ncbi:MAG: LacI family transcriptional regulator [Flavobacteriaceae bacterium]|nr:LacI family transcriptional regulator [Flavobacteriaceae bacterium]
MKKNATIKDIALKLNISISTVSRALRNAYDINPETKKKVLQLVEELDYEPNLLAKSLVQKKTKTIGVIVPEIDVHFFASCIRGIYEEAYERGYKLLIAQSNEDYDLEVESIQTMVSSRLDGLIVSLSKNTKSFTHFDKIIRREIPLVLFDRATENIVSSNVTADNIGGAFEATEHLINQGYTRIAHIGGPENLEISKKRFNGFKKAMKANSMEINPEYVVHCNLSKSDTILKVKKIMSLPKPPNAIFAVNDLVASEAIDYIKEIGLNIPYHVGVVGFNNAPFTKFSHPKLSSVNIPSQEMGRYAAQILIKQIEDNNIRIITEKLNCNLIIRESSNRKLYIQEHKI